MKAREARLLAEKIKSVHLTNQYDALMEGIKKEAEDGMMYYYFYGDIRLEVIEVLKNDGYKLTDMSTQGDGLLFKIEW